MDSDDGMESFEVNDADLEYALNPGARRHFQSKDQATYGIWADKEGHGSSDDERPSFSRGGRQKNYSAPVAFVSGGVKVGNKMEGESDAKNVDEPIEIDFERRRPAKMARKEQGNQAFAGMRGTRSGTVDPNKFADWMNKGGKGSVIMNMMKKMGYNEGEGLGSTGQGIIEPVQAALRPGKGAIGAYGKESSAIGPRFGESAADAQKRLAAEAAAGGGEREREAQAQQRQQKGSWKKSAKVKTTYKTLDDVLKEGGGNAATRPIGGGAGVKVIDMTGREQKVYSGYDAFSMRTRAENVADEDRENFDIPELVHNLNLLLDMTEEGIRRNDQQIRTLKDQTTALEYDLKTVESALEKEEREEKRMRECYELLESFSSSASSSASSMNDAQLLFRRLRADFPHEYALLGLEAVAIPLVLPLIRSFFARWNPLSADEVVYGYGLMKEWQEILQPARSGQGVLSANAVSMDKLPAWDRVLWDGWLPAVRRCALSWDPRGDCDSMLRFVDQWMSLLPVWIQENLLEQIIVPRLSARVSEWDPTRDPVPIHTWLLPWGTVLGDRLQPVLSPVRQMLAKALRQWNPRDSSALAMIVPWQGVWAAATMAAFLAQNIVPKLAHALKLMNLDPTANTKYEEWQACVDWLQLISPDVISSMLGQAFFPRWLETLHMWCDAAGASLNEIKQWYMEWQRRVPPQLSNHPAVKEHLRLGLVAIGESSRGVRVSGRSVSLPSAPTPPPLVPPMERRREETRTQQLSLKDVVEMTAAKHGLTYMPQNNRQRDGKQVYWFGAQSIYMDGGLVYLLDTQTFDWHPVSIDQLIQAAVVVKM